MKKNLTVFLDDTNIEERNKEYLKNKFYDEINFIMVGDEIDEDDLDEDEFIIETEIREWMKMNNVDIILIIPPLPY